MFEILKLSLDSIRANKLRTFLTITGIVVGIFSIIVIMTVITILQNSIEDGVSQLNKNTFQIQKWPAFRAGGDDDADFRNRPDITLDQYDRLKEILTNAKYVGAEQWSFGKMIKYNGNETNPNISIAGVTLDAIKTNNWNVADGREMRENDIDHNNRVCLIGKEVADKLFKSESPINKEIRVDGQPVLVIGVLEQQPQMFGQSRDSYIVMPISTFQGFYGKYNNSINITVMSYSKEDYNELIEQAVGYMRTIRKDLPGKINSFDVFSNESIMSQINNITGGVKIGAIAVSIIALIAAGIGIMNIMLVSVTERTREIGIRKAIGARKLSILSQFLFEAVILCVIGGIMGILLGVSLGNIAGAALNAKAAIPYLWIGIGLSLCIFVGLLFGTYPAFKAANLDPIEALRYE